MDKSKAFKSPGLDLKQLFDGKRPAVKVIPNSCVKEMGHITERSSVDLSSPKLSDSDSD